MFSRKKDAFWERIVRLISPRVIPVLRRHYLIIASWNLTELPDRRVQWLSAMVQRQRKKYLTLELSSVSNLVEDMCAMLFLPSHIFREIINTNNYNLFETK
jgi:hypothetical protein